ncbi:MAG: NAD(P)-binding domain-containing protein, partial [Haloplanus sp.]
MDVALLGGTGDIGGALALRWARDTDHTVVVGSRDAERARECAADYERDLA